MQTGLGRTGEIFGLDHWNVTPDMMTLGKSLGGGVVPVSAVLANSKVWSCMEDDPAFHTNNTGGYPLGCVAALTYINVMLEENLPEQAKQKGNYIKKKI